MSPVVETDRDPRGGGCIGIARACVEVRIALPAARTGWAPLAVRHAPADERLGMKTMNPVRWLSFAMGLCWLVAVQPVEAALKVGDPAPPLTISDWVKGSELPSDLSKGGKKLVLVEFWAVWCPPCIATIGHLTELQRSYHDQLAVVSVSALDARGNTLQTVREFVESQGDKISYTIAFDQAGITTRDYMEASGNFAIPYAFLIGREGALLWQGSPLDPEMDEVIRRAAAGEYDVETARRQQQVKDRLTMLEPLAQSGQWPQVRDGLHEILKIDPASDTCLGLLHGIYVNQLQDVEQLRAWASDHLEKHRQDGRVMRALAATLCSNPDLTTRLPDLALAAGRAAFEADSGNIQGARVYAFAWYLVGNLDQAIQLQKLVVERANGQEQEAARKVQNYYERCKALQSGDKP